MNIKILVATHKKFWMPEDKVYMPIQVGASLHNSLGYGRDDSGENISNKQENYSEVTAIYWAWKNLTADYIGINHYRRYFSNEKYNFFSEADKKELFFKGDFERLLSKAPVILPKKRNYFIETRYEQYKNAHNIRDLELCRDVLKQRHEEYIQTFDRVMNMRRGHIMNMFVMERTLFVSYCTWLFDILFSLESRVDLTGYSLYQQRVYGYIAERLLDVWIEQNNIKYIEADYVMLEKISWVKKTGSFLKRKFGRGEFNDC